MKLFEYQAKELFNAAGIPVPAGCVIENINQLTAVVDQVGLPCVLKSQVLQGGRGKAGLIQFAKTQEEAQEKTSELFGRDVFKVLVEKALDIDQELYLAVTVDPVSAKALIIAS